jgi:DNA-binding MarR family transcriptional regulator
MMIVDKKPIPSAILNDSVILHLASAYFSIVKQMEHKTQCSQTRGFIMSTLRGGTALNQNQIAKRLGLDRTVVHRSIKTMLREKLLSEKKAPSGRALLIQLTPKGNALREVMIKHRRAFDQRLRETLQPREIAALMRLLNVISDLKF